MNQITTDQVHCQLKTMAEEKEHIKIEDLAAALSAPIPIVVSHLHILEMFRYIIINSANNSVSIELAD